MGKNKQSRRAISADNSSRANRGIQQTHVYRKRVYDIVRRIPLRHVMTYGQIAIMLGEGYTPRTVGYVMHASEEEKTNLAADVARMNLNLDHGKCPDTGSPNIAQAVQRAGQAGFHHLGVSGGKPTGAVQLAVPLLSLALDRAA